MHESSAQVSPTYGTSQTQPLAYKVADAAAQLGIVERQMYRLIARGEIETFTVGRSRRISRRALTEYIERLEAAERSKAPNAA